MDKLPKGRRKQYVEVVATHRIDGTVRPQRIQLAMGEAFPIEEVKAVRPYLDLVSQEHSTEYTIIVHGQETHLWEDDGRWWVKMKEYGR